MEVFTPFSAVLFFDIFYIHGLCSSVDRIKLVSSMKLVWCYACNEVKVEMLSPWYCIALTFLESRFLELKRKWSSIVVFLCKSPICWLEKYPLKTVHSGGLILMFLASHFLVSAVCHIVKNFIAHLLNVKVPLILGMFETQLCCSLEFEFLWSLFMVIGLVLLD